MTEVADPGVGSDSVDGAARPLPTTARGRRSRQALLDAAREVFARDGFAAARITDIADTANAAHGSFYTYFSSKEEIFIALLREMEEALRGPRPATAEAGAAPDESGTQAEDLYGAILRANLGYLSAYREHCQIMIVWEQVATLNVQVEQLRRAASDRFSERIEHAIGEWQRDGLADRDLDPGYAALALTGMVSNFVYRWSARHGDVELEKAAEQLSLLWANALGVRVPAH